jgi:HEAT repeat protein
VNDANCTSGPLLPRGAFSPARGIERDDALLPLIRLLTDADPTVRRAAAFGLAELTMSDGVEALIMALGDPAAAVRGTIVFALGEIHDHRATPVLSQTVLSDSDPEVRRAAVWALGEIRDPRAIDAFQAASNDPRVRQTARHALAEIDDHGNR